MAQNIGETITLVAIALISLIFALYLIILRKNGWLGGKSNFYRCPNQECKKVFQKPIELKDLSMNPPRTYPACPECGTNLDPFINSIAVDPFLSSITKKILKTKSKPPLHPKINEIKPIEKRATTKREKMETPNQNQNQKKLPTLKEKTPTIETTMENRKPNTGDHSGCEYFFGYLSTLNIKEEAIPLICLECPKTLDCLVPKNK